MKALCKRLLADVPAIVERWETLARQAQGWLKLPPEHRVNGLPEVVVGLFESVLCSPADSEVHRDAVYAAARHGEDRRAQGVAEGNVFIEFSLLRQAIWAHVRTLDLPEERALAVVSLLDLAISVASQASLRGYYRLEAERVGRWPGIVDEVVKDSPLLAIAARNGRRGQPVHSG
jgi:hypothetical protein